MFIWLQARLHRHEVHLANHFGTILFGLVIKSNKVQCTVYRKEAKFLGKAYSSQLCLTLGIRHGDGHVSKLASAKLSGGECQHVGALVDATELAVELSYPLVGRQEQACLCFRHSMAAKRIAHGASEYGLADNSLRFIENGDGAGTGRFHAGMEDA